MKLFNLFRRQGTAPVARDRLQILLAYERGSTRGAPDLLALLREEILTAIGRHVEIDSNRQTQWSRLRKTLLECMFH